MKTFKTLLSVVRLDLMQKDCEITGMIHNKKKPGLYKLNFEKELMFNKLKEYI